MAKQQLLDRIECELRQCLEANLSAFKSEFNDQQSFRIACLLTVPHSAAEFADSWATRVMARHRDSIPGTLATIGPDRSQ